MSMAKEMEDLKVAFRESRGGGRHLEICENYGSTGELM